MRFHQIKEGSVEDLEKDLKDTKATSYDAIDRLMKAIAKEYDITPKKLHDLFVEKHGVIPDDWIKDKLKEDKNNCPPATQDITLNLKNRKKAIDEYGYGPLNPDLPNTKFWQKKMDEWNLDNVEEAKQSLCGNCAAFDIRQETLNCIAKGIDKDNPTDASEVIEAGDLGYCKFLKFKCASRRTCDAWVTGGPLTDKIEEKWSEKYKRSINCKNPKGFSQRAHCQGRKKKVKENFADGRNPQDKGDSKRYGVPTKASVTKLRKIAKQGGRKGQLAHWMANMKSGKRKKKTNESIYETPNLIDMLEVVLPMAMKELGLTKLPKMHLIDQVKDLEQPTFGQYRNQSKEIYIGVRNRHPLDVIRTIIHELVHHKQNLKGQLGPNSGNTGSPEENEAHAKAGIIMRYINKKYPEFFKSKNIS